MSWHFGGQFTKNYGTRATFVNITFKSSKQEDLNDKFSYSIQKEMCCS